MRSTGTRSRTCTARGSLQLLLATVQTRCTVPDVQCPCTVSRQPHTRGKGSVSPALSCTVASRWSVRVLSIRGVGRPPIDAVHAPLQRTLHPLPSTHSRNDRVGGLHHTTRALPRLPPPHPLTSPPHIRPPAQDNSVRYGQRPRRRTMTTARHATHATPCATREVNRTAHA